MKYTDKIFILTVFLIVLQVADIVTTTYLLAHNGIEANPFANPKCYIQASLKLFLPVLLGTLAILPINPLKLFKELTDEIHYQRLMIAIISLLDAFYLGILFNNTLWLATALGVI